MSKKLMALLLACLMVVSLVACGNSESGSGSGAGNGTDAGKTTAATENGGGIESTEKGQTVGTEDGQTAETGNDNATQAGDDQDGGSGAVDWEDMAELEVYYFTFVAPNSIQGVEDGINAITEDAINTHVTLHVLDIGSYIQQVGLMMSGGEQMDLMLTGFDSASFSSMMAQNQLMDISDYIDDYGPNIKNILGDLLKAGTIGDGVYCTPNYRNMVSSVYVFMREDVLEDLGLAEKARNMTSWSEYEEIMKAVTESEKWNYLKPLAVTNGAGLLEAGANLSGSFGESDVFDQLGDTLSMIHLDDSGKVSLNMESDSYKAAAALTADWYAKGYVYSDVSSDSSCSDLVKDNVVFSYITSGEFGAEESHTASDGYDMMAVEVCKTDLTSEACTKFAWCVPNTAAYPEAAVAFLNLAYTSPEINNLMAWGVEGVDYEVVDGVAQYIAGNETPEYHLFDYSVPNQFLVWPWGTSAADERERSEADLKAAPVSEYLGFSFDTSAITNSITALSNVKAEYHMQIISGAGGQEALDAYIQKLYNVGAQEYIDAYQTQLDAWLAEK